MALTYTPPAGTVNVGTASAPILQNIASGKTGAAVTQPNGATVTNMTGQAPTVTGPGGSAIPGAPKLDQNGNIIPGTGSAQTANSATAGNINNPAPTTPQATPLTTGTTAVAQGTAASTADTGANTGIPGTISDTSAATAAKYQAAHAAITAGGSDAPVDAGDGAAAAANAAKNMAVTQPPDNSNIQVALQNDPGYQQLVKDQQDYQNAANQTQSLTDQYQNLESQYNIPGIQTQLMNMQNVINGTEDDIRNEVTAAGGFATNSQVLALSDARNKTVIQNYNQLQATLTNAQNQVTTMIGLSKDDQANALNEITTKMGIDQQIADYTTKFQSNAKEGYNTIISAVGISGLYNGLINSDPSGATLANAAQVLGLTPAEMKTAAATDQQSRNLDTESKQLGIESSESGLATSALDRQNTELDIQNKQLMANPQLPNPARANMQGYDAQGILYTPDTAAAETNQWLKSIGAYDPNGSTKGDLPPTYYNQALAAWVKNGQSPTTFKSIYGGLQDPKQAKLYNS